MKIFIKNIELNSFSIGHCQDLWYCVKESNGNFEFILKCLLDDGHADCGKWEFKTEEYMKEHKISACVVK